MASDMSDLPTQTKGLTEAANSIFIYQDRVYNETMDFQPNPAPQFSKDISIFADHQDTTTLRNNSKPIRKYTEDSIDEEHKRKPLKTLSEKPVESESSPCTKLEFEPDPFMASTCNYKQFTAKVVEFVPSSSSTVNFKQLRAQNEKALLETILDETASNQSGSESEKEKLLMMHLDKIEHIQEIKPGNAADQNSEKTLSKLLAEELLTGSNTNWFNKEAVDEKSAHQDFKKNGSDKENQMKPKQMLNVTKAERTALGNKTAMGIIKFQIGLINY